MSASTPHEEAQTLARLTVLERVVGMMIRDSMLKAARARRIFSSSAETVKQFLAGRSPEGSTDSELSDAADRFFSSIASDIGSQDRAG